MIRVALVALAVASTAAAAPRQHVLHTQRVQGADVDAYVLSCARDSGKDALVVTARLHGRALGQVVLDESSACGGDDEDVMFHVTTSPFTLAPAAPGILVRAETGGEAIGREYWLIGVVDHHARVVWRDHYGTHEVVSIDNAKLVVQTAPDGRNELEFTAPFPYTNQCVDSPKDADGVIATGAFDDWRHVRLAYDPKSAAMKSLRVHEYGVTLGSFADVHAALALKCKLAARPACHMGSFLVLEVGDDTAPWTAFEGKQVVLTAIASSRSAADALARPDAGCPDRPAAKVDLLLDGPRPWEPPDPDAP